MVNFEDFEKVLSAANEQLTRLEDETKNIKKEIAQINQDRYEKVFEFFNQISLMQANHGIDVNKLFIPTDIRRPSTRGVSYPYYLIKLSWYKPYEISIGVYAAPTSDTYEIIDMRGDESSVWLRWLTLKEDYTSTKIQNRDWSEGCDLIDYLCDHLDEHEEAIAQNWKEAVTRYTAKKLKVAEENIRNAAYELMNK